MLTVYFVILRTVSKENHAGKNFIAHLSWHRNELENGVIQKVIWTDSRNRTAESPAKENTRRTAIHALMNGSMNIQHQKEELIQHNQHARLTQAPEVLHISISAPAEVRNFPRAVLSEVRNFPPMTERWRNNVEGAQEDDSSSTEIEPEPDIEFDGASGNLWDVVEFGKSTYADVIRQHPTEVSKHF